jgi:hypothetical protein
LSQNTIAHWSITESGNPYAHSTDLSFGGELARLGLHVDSHLLTVGSTTFEEPSGSLTFLFQDWHVKLGQGGAHRGPRVVTAGVVRLAEFAVEVGISGYGPARNPGGGQ